jgi:hypothetical protein
MIRDWRILSKAALGDQPENIARELEGRSRRPPRLTWGLQQQSFTYLASNSRAVLPDGCDALNVTDAVAGRVCNPDLWN